MSQVLLAPSEEQGAQAPPTKAITAIPSTRIQRVERRITLAVTIIPFLITLIAIPMLWGRGLGWSDTAVFFVMYCISGLGVTVGFHRMLTHRSFEASPAVRAALAVAGSMAVQGPVIRWVADHRRHHAFSDAPGDPHSPHLAEAEGVKGVISGLWHSHVGWMFDKESTKVSRFAPDLVKEAGMQKVDHLFPLLVLISLGAPALLGFAFSGGRLNGALTGLIWGGFVRIFFLHHVTWSINSICHFYGKRPFESKDFSTNNWILSLVSFGEAWHNNHHAFPTSARHGLGRFQFDPSAGLIRLMEKAGLVWNVKVPNEEQMLAKRI